MTALPGGAGHERDRVATCLDSAPPVPPGLNSHPVQPLRQAGPVTSSHSDIFPLPCPGLARHDLGQHRAAQQAAARRRSRHAGVAESIVALNALASASALSPLAIVNPPARVPNEPQASVIDRVGRRVSRWGAGPGTPPKEALFELLKTNDMYDTEPQGLEVFDAERLKVLKRPTCPKPLETVSTGFALTQHLESERHFERTAA